MGRRRRLRAHVRRPGGERDAGLLHLRAFGPRPQAAPAAFGRAPRALSAGGGGAREGGGGEGEAGENELLVKGPREAAAAAEDGFEEAAAAERPERRRRRRSVEVGVVGAPPLRKVVPFRDYLSPFFFRFFLPCDSLVSK